MDRIPSRWLPGGLALVALLVGCSSGGEEAWSGPGTSVKVMTRNVYLGGEFDSLLKAQTMAQIPGLVDAFWNGVQASNFPARAALIADEVATEMPDIVAFQELELFRMQIPSDFDPKAAPSATDTAPNGDLLAILTAALASRGLDYGEPVAVATHTDTEMPGVDASSGTTYDLRLTDRDAVFARPGLTVSNVRTADFPTFISLPVPLGNLGAGILVQLKRGYAAMDVQAGGVPLTFAATHLEVGGQVSAFQEDEARDLMTALAPIAGPLVLMGDFNSAANLPSTQSYSIVTHSFTDAWSQVNPTDAAPTCCTDIASPAPAPTDRIDLVLYRGHVHPQTAERTGTDSAERTASGLLPSDHQGVSATLTVGQ
ncbi:MAG TPA: endonuclease/exonuclease/phosphatase family protein [Polyangia bacterium]|jgi:endonuclease/exonuclease/phosphatase family metal-dependent hydrolase|nr:endonuclease/exonuclease/phosphatase family protein [Polyangia bacterium]